MKNFINVEGVGTFPIETKVNPTNEFTKLIFNLKRLVFIKDCDCLEIEKSVVAINIEKHKVLNYDINNDVETYYIEFDDFNYHYGFINNGIYIGRSELYDHNSYGISQKYKSKLIVDNDKIYVQIERNVKHILGII